MSDYPKCTELARLEGRPYPRTCEECGLGPCKRVLAVENETSRKVYVVARDGGYEGYSEPLRCFASRRLAQIFCDGADSGYSHSTKIFEMSVEDHTGPEKPA